jgi:hypothetical protein
MGQRFSCITHIAKLAYRIYVILIANKEFKKKEYSVDFLDT